MLPNLVCKIYGFESKTFQENTIPQAACEYVEEYLWDYVDEPYRQWDDIAIVINNKRGVIVDVCNTETNTVQKVFVTARIEFDAELL